MLQWEFCNIYGVLFCFNLKFLGYTTRIDPVIYSNWSKNFKMTFLCFVGDIWL